MAKNNLIMEDTKLSSDEVKKADIKKVTKEQYDEIVEAEEKEHNDWMNKAEWRKHIIWSFSIEQFGVMEVVGTEQKFIVKNVVRYINDDNTVDWIYFDSKQHSKIKIIHNWVFLEFSKVGGIIEEGDGIFIIPENIEKYIK